LRAKNAESRRESTNFDEASKAGKRPCRRRTRAKAAFTLLELMIVVVILGIITAIAVPSFVPMLHRSQLQAATESVASFLGKARVRATSERRCVKVVVVTATNTETAMTHLQMQRYNTFDCENPGPLIDSGASLYGVVDNLYIETERVTVEMRRPAGAALGTQELIYRSSGWLHSADATTTDDDVEIRVTHARLSGVQAFRPVLADAHGPICVNEPGVSLGSNPSCF